MVDVYVDPDRFDELVGQALESIPAELAKAIRNVAIFIADDSPEYGLLGLYEGVPLTARDSHYGGVLPDRITIFRNAVCRICASEDEIRDQVRITVVHEVAHHFGIDDRRLHELGWA
jgi:predicted Zn-dependent protease with MMP-like domain